mmetsp:Transcript_30277/g.100396  ORF Transcript_30277/g.100396 Transcript_30277/m.100396 type:complete len:269 (-) Transcript_30277:193-999(-)
MPMRYARRRRWRHSIGLRRRSIGIGSLLWWPVSSTTWWTMRRSVLGRKGVTNAATRLPWATTRPWNCPGSPASNLSGVHTVTLPGSGTRTSTSRSRGTTRRGPPGSSTASAKRSRLSATRSRSARTTLCCCFAMAGRCRHVQTSIRRPAISARPAPPGAQPRAAAATWALGEAEAGRPSCSPGSLRRGRARSTKATRSSARATAAAAQWPTRRRRCTRPRPLPPIGGTAAAAVASGAASAAAVVVSNSCDGTGTGLQLRCRPPRWRVS